MPKDKGYPSKKKPKKPKKSSPTKSPKSIRDRIKRDKNIADAYGF